MAGNKSQSYAQILLGLVKDSSLKTDEKAKKFVQLLRKRGDTKLFSRILREFERRWESAGEKTARVVSAKKLEGSVREATERSLKELGYQMKEETNPELKEGTAIFLGKDYLIDGSVQGKLRELWRQTIK
ncbi:MAG: F0F1 ATP synthase subunit delta [Candidatus Wildermuthbacteria bacterium]|nr:F0F1 ATP synthase subunit delta [Candidatus Wildermuthbacteria bacterium]